MTRKSALPPDLMRRFTPTPYVFELNSGTGVIRIEAEDLQLALSLRHVCSAQSADIGEPIVFWRLVRERRGAMPQAAESIFFSSGKLRMLLHGTGTLLIQDMERREVLGFIGAEVQVTQLTEKLIPLLRCSYAEPSMGRVLQTSDKWDIGW